MMVLFLLFRLLCVFLSFNSVKSILICYTSGTGNSCCPSGGSDDVIFSDNVTTISNNAFNGCSNLRSVVLPDSVTTVDTAAFYSCQNLLNVTLSINLVSLGDSSFRLCGSLRSLAIPSSIRSIGRFIIYQSDMLTSFSLPNDYSRITFATDTFLSQQFPQLKSNLVYCPYFSNDTSITYTAGTYTASPVCSTPQPTLLPTWIPTAQPSIQSVIDGANKKSAIDVSDIRVVIGLCVGLPIIVGGLLLLLGYYMYTIYYGKDAVAATPTTAAAATTSTLYAVPDSTVSGLSAVPNNVSHGDYINKDDLTPI